MAANDEFSFIENNQRGFDLLHNSLHITTL